MEYELNLVLVEPQIPQNTGNITRTCAVTGARLHLVQPLGFVLDDKHLKRAGLDYWDALDVTIYNNLEEFFSKNPGPFFYFTTKGRQCYAKQNYPQRVYLVFGREDAGLPEELLAAHPGEAVRVPMRQGFRSLNLSNTVALSAYEVLRQWDFPDLEEQGQLTKYRWEDLPGDEKQGGILK